MAADGRRRAPAAMDVEAGDADGDLSPSEKTELAWLKATISGVSGLFTTWNAYNIQQLLTTRDKAQPRSDKAFVVANFFIYGLFTIMSNTGAYNFAKNRAWLSLVSFMAMLHIEYLLFMACYEMHRLVGTSWDVLGPVLACVATMAALIWSLAVAPEWWEKKGLIPHHPRRME